MSTYAPSIASTRIAKYWAANPEKYAEHLRKKAEKRRGVKDENNSSHVKLATQRKTTVKKYVNFCDWDEILGDLRNVQGELTQRGEKRYTTVVDFEIYIKAKVEKRMSYLEYEPEPVEDTTDVGKVVDLYMAHHAPKDDGIEYDVNNEETYPTAWNVDRWASLNDLRNMTKSSVEVLRKKPKCEREKFNDCSRLPWDMVRSELDHIIVELNKLPGHDTLIPISVSKKCPKYPHKWSSKLDGYEYTLEMFERELCDDSPDGLRYKYENDRDIGFGILCSSLVCVDFDTPEEYDLLRKEGILKDGLVELSRGGVHVYYQQNPEYNELYDTKISDTIDFKGLTRATQNEKRDINTYTRGLVVCYPTIGYDRRNVFTPKQLTFDLCRWYYEHKPEDKISGVVGIDTDVVDDEFVKDLELRYNGHFLSAKVSDSGMSYHFKRTCAGECPGGHIHRNNCFFINVSTDKSVFYRCLSSECDKSYFIGSRGYLFIDEDPDEIHEFKSYFDSDDFMELIQNLKTDKGHSPDALDIIYKEFSKYHVMVNSQDGQYMLVLSYIRPGVYDIPVRWDLQSYEQTCNKDFILYPDGKRAKFFDNWRLNIKHRKAARGLTFNPNQKYGFLPNKIYNMWCGVRATRETDITTIGDFNGYLDSILKILWNLSDYNDEMYTYIINWIHAIMNGKKTGKILAFVNSPGGCGKGTFWNKFMYHFVIGNNISYITQNKADIVGNFNGSAIENNLLLVFDEAMYTANEFEFIKSISTETTTSVADKNVKQHNVDNYVNMVMLSNHRVYGLDDRRMVYIVPSKKMVNDLDFWKDINTKLSSDTNSPYYADMKKTACAFVKYVRDYVEVKPYNINISPECKYKKSVHSAPPMIQSIDRSMVEFRTQLKKDNRYKSIPQREVMDIVRSMFEEQFKKHDFNNGTCHNTLLSLGFKESKHGITHVDSYTIPDATEYESVVKEYFKF